MPLSAPLTCFVLVLLALSGTSLASEAAAAKSGVAAVAEPQSAAAQVADAAATNTLSDDTLILTIGTRPVYWDEYRGQFWPHVALSGRIRKPVQVAGRALVCRTPATIWRSLSTH
jgi:hypothetical protein